MSLLHAFRQSRIAAIVGGGGGGSSPANIATSGDFTDGTAHDFAYLGTGSPVDFPNDPTGLLGGKVNRILYSPGAGPASNDINMEVTTAHHYRYGETLWLKGSLVIPSTLSDGVTPKSSAQHDDIRKLVDYLTGPQLCRQLLERRAGKLLWYVEGDRMTGNVYHEDILTASTGIVLQDDTKYTIEMRLVLNSADQVRDGTMDIYVNNSTNTPSFSASGFGWITENGGGTYFNGFRFGTQLSTFPGESAYSEYRYWKDYGISTQRIA